jgi:hypothetical protein
VVAQSQEDLTGRTDGHHRDGFSPIAELSV